MRPLRLRMVGFGPFAQEAIVDFHAATDHPLFGIYGPTGSGKTSVLDAIAFALFGESSGDERKSEDLRSHFVGPEEETVVELLFETGGKRYFLRRSPKQELRKRRGEGVTEKPGEAYLFDATAVDLGELSYPDRCGTVLAEKKVGSVSRMVEEIVGFRAEQFRQVVLLPQGRFRELLTANSGERSEILRRLFDTAVYERFTDILKERSSTLGGEIERLRTTLEALRSGAGVESRRELEAQVAALSRQLAELDETVEKQRALEEARRKQLDEARSADRAFRERAEARAALASIEGESMEAQQRELEGALAARAIEPHYRQLLAAREEIEALEGERLERKRSLEGAEQEREVAEAALREGQESEGLREHLRLELGRLDSLAEKQRLVDDQTRGLPERERRLSELRSRRERLTEELERLEVRLEEITLRIEEASRMRERRGEVESELEGKRRRLTLLNRYRDALARARGEEGNLEKLEERVGALSAELASCEVAITEAIRRTREAEAARLAQTLSEGEPCPVCGSLDHPAPAVGEGASQEEVEGAREREAEVRNELTRAERERSVAAERLRQAQEQREELLGELGEGPGDGEQERLAAVVAELEGELRELHQRLSESGELSESREEGRERRVGLKAELEELAPRLDAEGEEVARMRSLRESSGVPEELSPPGALEKLRREVAQRLESNIAAARKAETDARNARELASRERLRLESLEERRLLVRERLELLEAEFRRRIEESGFLDEREYASAGRGDEQVSALKEALDARRDRESAARERVRRAEEVAAGFGEPDLPAAEAAVAASQERLTALLEERSAKRHREGELLRLLEAITAGERELSQIEEEYREVTQLSRLADGYNESRIRLMDYVLSVYFEEVLAQANIRLFKMSNHRYTLLRKEASGGRGRAGLDIEVYDAYTDRSRDAKTLSGGEGFLASLALALGLSDTVQAELGGLNLEVIFIDEGFGSLDEEALEEALNTLDELTGSGRSVGIISHVEEVKRRVPAGFQVESTLRGSRIVSRGGGGG